MASANQVARLTNPDRQATLATDLIEDDHPLRGAVGFRLHLDDVRQSHLHRRIHPRCHHPLSPFAGELRAEPLSRLVQPGLDGSDRDPQCGRRLGVREPADIEGNDRLALPTRQFRDRSGDPALELAFLSYNGRVGHGFCPPVEEGSALERRSGSERVVDAQPTSTDVEADPDEPAAEPLWIPKPRHAQKGCYGCVLYHLVDSSAAFQRSAADGREHGPVVLEQPTESLAVATPRPLHEFAFTFVAVEDLHVHPNSRVGAPPGYP